MRMRAFKRKLERNHDGLRRKLQQALSEAEFPLDAIDRCAVAWDHHESRFQLHMWPKDGGEPYRERVGRERDFPSQDTINRLLLFI
jgi:hypothetical protein